MDFLYILAVAFGVLFVFLFISAVSGACIKLYRKISCKRFFKDRSDDV